MTLADELLGKHIPKITGKRGRRVLMGTHRKPAKAPKPKSTGSATYTQRWETEPRLMGVMADGRARSLVQVVHEARVNKWTAWRYLRAAQKRGDVEITIIAGHQLFSVTHQSNSHAAG